MMRSGIPQPGAIPFLAILVFSLLSLVPSLAKEWDLYNLQVGYIGYQRHEVRRTSGSLSLSLSLLAFYDRGRWLIRSSAIEAPRKDDSIDIWSRFRTSGAGCPSWMIDAGSCPPPPPRRAVLETPPHQSSFEAAPIYDDPASYVDGPSTLTRGVRAFKALVKQLDTRPDHPSEPTESCETFPTRSTPASSNFSISPLPFGLDNSAPPVSDDSIPATAGWHLRFRELWQQACRVGNDYLEKMAQYRSREQELQSPGQSTDSPPESQLMPPSKPSEEPVSETHPANGSSVALGADRIPSSVLSTQAPNPIATTAGQSKNAGFGQDSEHMRGSCMAIVIALVAGVMWF